MRDPNSDPYCVGMAALLGTLPDRVTDEQRRRFKEAAHTAVGAAVLRFNETPVGMTPRRLAALRPGLTAGDLRASGALGAFTRSDYPDGWVLRQFTVSQRRHGYPCVRLEFGPDEGPAFGYLEVRVEEGGPTDAQLWELADGVLDVALDLLGDMPTCLEDLLGEDGYALHERYQAALVARRREDAAHVPSTIRERADAARARIKRVKAAADAAQAELVAAEAALDEVQFACKDENREKLSGAVDCSGDCKYRCLDCGKVWWG